MLSIVLLSVIALATCRPQLPADVSEAQCPNFPYCAVAVDLSAFTPAQQAVINQHNAIARANQPPPQVPGLAEHQAAEAQVLAAQGLNPGQLSHSQAEARVLQYEAELKAAAGI